MIVDTPNSIVPYISMFKANGVVGVIRYDDRFSTWKQCKVEEAHALATAGIELGIVYEHAAYPSGYQLGYDDASWSLYQATLRGQPNGSAIYYAVDHDWQRSETGVLQYFAGIAQAHKDNAHVHLRIGCYGSGLLNSTLLQIYPDLLPWITCSTGFAGSAQFVHDQRYTLWQEHCDRNLHGLDVDINIARLSDWGQFLPFAKPGPAPAPVPIPVPSPIPVPVPVPVPPVPHWPPNVGLQDGVASWYADGTNADMSPVNNATDMTCAHRYFAFGTKLKATRKDNGKFCIVTCHDRGPYVGGRIIDFRPAAARALDMINDGIALIHLELAT